MKEKNSNKLDFLKMKNCCFVKDNVKGMKSKSQTRRKYL